MFVTKMVLPVPPGKTTRIQSGIKQFLFLVLWTPVWPTKMLFVGQIVLTVWTNQHWTGFSAIYFSNHNDARRYCRWGRPIFNKFTTEASWPCKV